MTQFKSLNIGDQFTYDNERFIKTEDGSKFDPPNAEGGLAWSIHNGDRYKEWAFTGTEKVKKLEKDVGIMFPRSRVKQFNAYWNRGDYRHQRRGQAFFNHLNLHKCTQDKEFLDKLYEADGEEAIKIIESRTDYMN